MLGGRRGRRVKGRCIHFCKALKSRAEARYYYRVGGTMKQNAKELAEAIGAAVEGDGSVELSGVAAPERASSRDLIFVDSAKQAARVEASSARCVVLPDGFSVTGKTVLRAQNAKVAFAKA